MAWPKWIVRLAVGAAWMAVGGVLTVGVQALVGRALDDVASYTFLGSWVAGAPCGVFAALLLLSATCTVGVVLWLCDTERAPSPRTLPVYVGTVVATWCGIAVVPGIACSLCVAVLAAFEVRTRRLGRWWIAVACMVGWCAVELPLYGGLLFVAGC